MHAESRLSSAIWCLLCLLGLTGAVFADDSFSTSSLLEPGRLSAGGRFSGEVQEFVVDGLVPIWKPDNTVLFLNLRGSFVDGGAQEFNGGLVARYLVDRYDLILGINGYYDRRRTQDDNTFGQVGVGVELLSKWVDLRANYYDPQTDNQTINTETVTTTETVDQLLTTTVLHLRRYEEALSGFDTEIGVWLPYLDSRIPTAIYAGYYDFSSDFEDDISGFRMRVESRVHPNLTLDAEWYEDGDLNKTDYFVGFRLHLPLDFWNGVRVNRSRDAVRVAPFASRMGDMVNRDFRIRTIRTRPIQVGVSVEETVLAGPASTEPDPIPEQAPTCYLNSQGDVVCN